MDCKKYDIAFTKLNNLANAEKLKLMRDIFILGSLLQLS